MHSLFFSTFWATSPLIPILLLHLIKSKWPQIFYIVHITQATPESIEISVVLENFLCHSEFPMKFYLFLFFQFMKHYLTKIEDRRGLELEYFLFFFFFKLGSQCRDQVNVWHWEGNGMEINDWIWIRGA